MLKEEIDPSELLNKVLEHYTDTPLHRFRARKLLTDKYGLTEQEALDYVPKLTKKIYKEEKSKPKTTGNRFKTGITITIRDKAIEIAENDGIDAAIDFIIKETSTNNSAMNQISRLKTALKLKGMDVSDIDNSEKRKQIQDLANETIENQREEKLYNKVFYVHPMFMYDNVINRLINYKTEPIINNLQFIADMLIAFSARPSELYSLKIIGTKIIGHLKSRDNKAVKYVGLYSIPIAKQMLLKLPQLLDLRESKNIKKLSVFMQKYKMQPRALRLLGAEYITKEYEPTKQRRIRQIALRHKNINTSLTSYQMPLNVSNS